MIEPWVDIQADIDAINAGEGYCHRASGRIWVNGRMYGTHTDRSTGTVFPISGDGFILLTSAQFVALRTYARYTGINEQSERELGLTPNLSEEDCEIARRLWRMREDARGR